jgi:hypothetical protein
MALGNGERYYSPALGRFIQQDTWTGMAAMAQTMNRYGYANGNPLRYTDLDGHQAKDPNKDPNPVGSILRGVVKGVFDAALEPFRQVADILVAGAARAHGIDPEHWEMSSALGKSQLQQVLAGEDSNKVAFVGAAKVVGSTIFGAVTFGIGPAALSIRGDYKEYRAGRMTRTQFNERIGEQIGAVIFDAVLERAVKGSDGRAAPDKTVEGRTGGAAAERMPLPARALDESAAGPPPAQKQLESGLIGPERQLTSGLIGPERQLPAATGGPAPGQSRGAYLRQKYGHLSGEQRAARIDELSRQNYARLLDEAINKQEYVYRYLTQSGYEASVTHNSVAGYTTTEFSASAPEVMSGGQVKKDWGDGKPPTGPPIYGVAIPVKSLRGFQVPRPFGGKGKTGWEPFTNSYPEAGPGGWSQFKINPVPLNEVFIFSLTP